MLLKETISYQFYLVVNPTSYITRSLGSFWYISGMNDKGVTNHFLLGFKVSYIRQTPVLPIMAKTPWLGGHRPWENLLLFF